MTAKTVDPKQAIFISGPFLTYALHVLELTYNFEASSTKYLSSLDLTWNTLTALHVPFPSPPPSYPSLEPRASSSIRPDTSTLNQVREGDKSPQFLFS